MDILLYSITDEQNKINKSLSDPLTLSGALRENCSIVQPSLNVQGGETVSRYNYMYIPAFHRYYFINDVTSVRNNLWRIDANVDVLTSFKNEILALSCVVDSNTSPDYESYVMGDAWMATVKESTSIINFPGGLNETGEYVLITSGG